MGGRGTAFREDPLVVVPQKCGLFLRARYGQAQFVDGAHEWLVRACGQIAAADAILRQVAEA